MTNRQKSAALLKLVLEQGVNFKTARRILAAMPAEQAETFARLAAGPPISSVFVKRRVSELETCINRHTTLSAKYWESAKGTPMVKVKNNGKSIGTVVYFAGDGVFKMFHTNSNDPVPLGEVVDVIEYLEDQYAVR